MLVYVRVHWDITAKSNSAQTTPELKHQLLEISVNKSNITHYVNMLDYVFAHHYVIFSPSFKYISMYIQSHLGIIVYSDACAVI